MIHRLAAWTALLAAPLAGAVGVSAQGKISTTEAQLLATMNGSSADEAYWVLTLQHFSTWTHGSNFFFLDVVDQPGLGGFFSEHPGLYLEFGPVLSLGGLGVVSPRGGALRDVGVTAQLNSGWGALPQGGFPIERVFLGGIEGAWSVPGFAVFNSQLLARWERGSGVGWQATWVYALPLPLGPVGAAVSGFLDVWQRQGEDGHLVLMGQPQILLSLGSPEPGESHLQFGVELEPSYNFPSRAVSDGWNLAVSPMVRWVF